MNGADGALRTFRIGGKLFELAEHVYVMGVLNVTPDSFSDGGNYFSPARAVEHALAMAGEGADIIDVGGESTRPKSSAYGDGAQAVDAEEELRRVVPVIHTLAGKLDVPISIDTTKAEVARRALEEGASLVNDISGFRLDPTMPATVAAAGGSAVVMHMKGTPRTMQQDPVYDDLFGEILGSLRASVAAGEEAGIRQMFVDPGVGFGKTLDHNLRIIAGLSRFRSLGYPVMIGPSRKSFVGTLLDLPVGDRLEGTLAAVVACVLNGASMVRVHDVREAKRAVVVAEAIRAAGERIPDLHG